VKDVFVVMVIVIGKLLVIVVGFWKLVLERFVTRGSVVTVSSWLSCDSELLIFDVILV